MVDQLYKRSIVLISLSRRAALARPQHATTYNIDGRSIGKRTVDSSMLYMIARAMSPIYHSTPGGQPLRRQNTHFSLPERGLRGDCNTYETDAQAYFQDAVMRIAECPMHTDDDVCRFST